MVVAGAKMNGEMAGVTPLHAAARMGHRHVVEWLLGQEIDRHARARCGPWQGKSALALALENGHEEVAALLDARGAVR
jgi:ankyrin repeat protein